jgi:hypothetical protein
MQTIHGSPRSELVTSPAAMPKPSLEPIRDEDLEAFCTFLNAHLNPTIPAATWADAFRQPWGIAKPNNGFLLRDKDGRIVGGIGAIYAERVIRGRPERFCNITSWCVLGPYRSHSLRMALALVSQPGFHFTDLSPTPVVAGSLRFLRFKDLDGWAMVMFNLPAWSPGVRVLSDHDAIERALTPDDARAFRDHRHFPWLLHAAAGRPGAFCHVAYKRGVLKRLPCAVVLYASAPELFLRYRGTLGCHFLTRHGMVSTRIETRLLPRRPALSAKVVGYHNGMYRSDTLSESDISNLYSELAALDL